jgi:uncharacterized protein
MDITEKKIKLQVFLDEFESIVVAYSGGIDSTMMLQLCAKTCKRICAVIVKTFFTSKTDFVDAIDFCKERNINHAVIEPDKTEFASIMNNPVDRCYLCKKIIFTKIKEYATNNGYDMIVDGSNSSDVNDYRPGKKALMELGITSPFVEAGIGKDDIRMMAKEENLKSFDKPSNSCLLTRIPYGKTVTEEKIYQIDRGEIFLKDLGFNVVRLRHFDNIAVIEVGHNERNKLFDLKILDRIEEFVTDLGFDHATIDAGGYKTGNLNKFLEKMKTYG